jgi:hypothetical protein
MKYVARYSGPNRSGICKCKHRWEDHHLGCVMNRKYYEDTGEDYVPQECEFYFCNEMGGCNKDGSDHCHRYIDEKDDQKD